MAGPGPVSHPAPTPRNDIPRGEGFAPPTPATPWEASEVNVSPRLPPRYCFPATHPRLYLCSSDEGPEEEVGCPSCLFNVSISCFSEVHLPPRSREGPSGLGGFPGLGLLPVITCSHSTSILGGSSAQGQTLMQNRSRHLHVYQVPAAGRPER